MWNSYNNSVVSSFFKIAQHLACFLLLLYALIRNHGRLNINVRGFIILVLSIILFVHINFGGSQYRFGSILVCLDVTIGIVGLLSLNVYQRMVLCKTVIVVFVIITLPGLLYYLLYLLGFTLDYSVLPSDHPGKIARGMYYMHKTFGLIIVEPGKIPRYTGLFDEPGMVGTTAALLFAAGYKHVKTKWIILLAIEGIFSFSLAFYGLVIIFFAAKLFLKNPIKMICAVGVFIYAITLFRTIHFDNRALISIQNRFEPNSTLTIKNNRYGKRFAKEYNKFWTKGGYPLYMGTGGLGAYAKNPVMIGANTYKCLVYDLGIIGCALFLTFFISIVFMDKKTSKGVMPFLLIFIVSLYQRAYVYKFSTVAIFVLAITMIHYEHWKAKRALIS